MTDWYANEIYKDYVLDESALELAVQTANPVKKSPNGLVTPTSERNRADVIGEVKDLVVSVSQNDCGYSHHMASMSEIKVFLFDYWKHENPEKFERIRRKTLARFKSVKGSHQKLEEHYVMLANKSIGELTFNDLDGSRMRQWFPEFKYPTVFKSACRTVIYKAKKIGLLKVVDFKRENYYGVNQEFLMRLDGEKTGLYGASQDLLVNSGG